MWMDQNIAHPQKPPVVLVVEDDWVINGLIQDILEFEGFKVFTVETAEEAWDFLIKGCSKVDLIFLDIHLPGLLSGIDLANLVHQRWAHLPIILSSGSRSKESLDSGYTPLFLPKPWHSLQIGALCRRALASGNAAREKRGK